MIFFSIALPIGPEAVIETAYADDFDRVGFAFGLNSFDLDSRNSLHNLILKGQGSTSQAIDSTETHFYLF